MNAKTRLGAPPTDFLKLSLRMCWNLYQLDMDARHLRPKSHQGALYACEKIIHHFGETTDVRQITSQQLKVFFAALNKKLAPQTVETVFRKSKTWFEFLVREEILMVNPFNGLKNIKLDRTVLPHLKQAEIEHILKAIGKPRTPLELRNALIFYTALETGLRLSELADLEREDLDLPRLIVRRGKMGQSGQANDWRITKS